MALKVNGEEIQDALIQEEAERLRPHYQSVFADQKPEEQEAQLLQWSKENVIERILLQQHARNDARPVAAETIDKAFADLVEKEGGEETFFKNANITRDDIPQIKADPELQMRLDRLINDLTEKLEPPTEDEARKYYQQNKTQFITSEHVHAAHIVVDVDENTSDDEAHNKILAAQKDLQAGKNFEELANTYSSCPGEGVDLGFFPRGQMVQSFEDVVFAMKPGEISDIIKTEFGYHIAKVYEKRPPRAVLFDRVKEQIVQYLYDEKRNKAVEDFIDQLREKAVIEEN